MAEKGTTRAPSTAKVECGLSGFRGSSARRGAEIAPAGGKVGRRGIVVSNAYILDDCVGQADHHC